MRIAITGRAGAGKTTLANALVKRLGFVRISFADPIRVLAHETFGIRVQKPYPAETRKILQLLGECGLLADKLFWVKKAMNRMYDFEMRGKRDVVIDDLRMPWELEELRRHGFYIIGLRISEKALRERMGEYFVPRTHVSERHVNEIVRSSDLIINTGESNAAMTAAIAISWINGLSKIQS